MTVEENPIYYIAGEVSSINGRNDFNLCFFFVTLVRIMQYKTLDQPKAGLVQPLCSENVITES